MNGGVDIPSQLQMQLKMEKKLKQWQNETFYTENISFTVLATCESKAGDRLALIYT